MLRALTARRIAAAAAVGGGGITALGGMTFALVVAEAKLARKIIQGTPSGSPPVADGVYGLGLPGAPLSFAMLGDSTAAGLGVQVPDETPAAMLAAGLSSIAGRPVRLTNVAVSGSRSAALEGQTGRALEAVPDVAVIMIGANDVTGRVPAGESVRHLGDAVRRLREAGCQVVVGTCPDLGSVKPVMQPLRWIAQRASRQLAAAQTIAVVENGGRSVSLGDLLGREFAAAPVEMFSADRYHPSARGYAAAAMAVLPSMAIALGLDPDHDHDEVEHLPPARRAPGGGVLPVYLAAAEAVERPGTEVAGARVAGRESGRRGRWATLLRRPRGVPGRQPRLAGAVADVPDAASGAAPGAA
ncbi:SGNH/GDSL hydrolase family protein [Actinomadura parmotrematis]|uniref:SGNH/GDSL hydrolase family protein n=1 Tax=Actinomadura parmotrematis TaxID=2864039 RepID=A0ABS7FMF7_9ACTN|nr:SGNH/GDSL hydrolase family protein [Actinomadura parmotrematis]MBW8481565.1 SGNH/GDSL hydrolase family protein [Actinomadura parmotrematis]